MAREKFFFFLLNAANLQSTPLLEAISKCAEGVGMWGEAIHQRHSVKILLGETVFRVRFPWLYDGDLLATVSSVVFY
jgi:hypothetical protein